MLRYVLTVFCILAAGAPLEARVLSIGPGGYSDLSAAAADALPGDTLYFTAGTHAGGTYVENLWGTESAPIVIMGDPAGGSVIEGGTNAFQLSDPRFVRIVHLIFDGQSGNGINIDDGGSFETPAHNIVIEHCTWRGIAATGNNDLCKLSGVDTFRVVECTFLNGSPGGSMIDMVGCHWGEIIGNRFENGGSNCIQAKGGTRDLLVSRNRFFNGGQRAINIGGSTGLPYFRPQDADAEASRILVWANIFTGSVAPIAFVGAVRCDVLHNTIYLPEKWAVRILQENTDARFQQCGDNIFRNNLVVIDNRAASPTFNIGPNTRPQTFLMGYNLWYNVDDAQWQGPNTPVPDILSIVNRDPLLTAPGMTGGDFTPAAGSPAIGAGLSSPYDITDFLDARFNSPPTIGAIEADPVISSARTPPVARNPEVSLYPQPARDIVQLHAEGFLSADVHVLVHDAAGRRLRQLDAVLHPRSGRAEAVLDLSGIRSGWYIVTLIDGTALHSIPMNVVR